MGQKNSCPNSHCLKNKIAEELNKGEKSFCELAKGFKTSKSPVARIKGPIKFYLSLLEDTTNKRVGYLKHHCLYDEIIDELKIWRSGSIPISKHTIIEISKKVFEKSGLKDFKFSNNWLYKFSTIVKMKRRRL